MADKELTRQIKLKTGSAKRLFKEYQSYQHEETREKQRLEKLAHEDADEVLIKQQKNVISETSQMIPYCKKKLEQAVEELNKYIEENVTEEHKQLEAYVEATTILTQIDEANIFVRKNRN